MSGGCQARHMHGIKAKRLLKERTLRDQEGEYGAEETEKGHGVGEETKDSEILEAELRCSKGEGGELGNSV